jgi:nucleoside-diphosphate-sugar epimerase
MPGIVYGAAGGLIERLMAAPANDRGAVAYIGTGDQHWALVHVEDIADVHGIGVKTPRVRISARCP